MLSSKWRRGMIVCMLRDLIRVTALRWRLPLSERAIARCTELSVDMGNRLAPWPQRLASPVQWWTA
jgi:hypothetical protein